MPGLSQTVSKIQLSEFVDRVLFGHQPLRAVDGPFGGFSVFDFRWVPIPDGINRYMLTAKNLAAGEYQVFVDGRLIGKTNAGHLSRGLNISTMTADPWQPGGPWDAQSLAVRELVDARL